MHDGINYWLLLFNSNGRVQVCDSLYKTLGSVTKRCLKALYKSLLDKNGKLSVTMIPVKMQIICNCVCDKYFGRDFICRV